MNVVALSVLLLNVLCNTIGQMCLKASAMRAQSFTGLAHWKQLAKDYVMWVGILVFAIELLSWVYFLSLVPLSVGILVGSCDMITIMLCGRMFFDETLTMNRVIGALLIAIGVTLVGI